MKFATAWWTISAEHDVEPYEAEDCFYNAVTDPEEQLPSNEVCFRTNAGRLLKVIYTILGYAFSSSSLAASDDRPAGKT